MKITAVLKHPVQYTLGVPEVFIPYCIAAPSALSDFGCVTTTQEALGGDNWGDEQVRAAVLNALTCRFADFPDVSVEVLLLHEWVALETTQPEPEPLI